MASSSRLSLISPLRVWLVFNGLFVALVASAWYGSYRLAASDNQRLIASEVTTLTNARFDDIQHRRFRDFVEGAGRDFNDLYVRLEIGKEVFQFGDLPAKRHCAEASYPLSAAGKAEEARVTMCRPFRFSSSPVLIVLFVFLVVSGIALSVAQRLERRTTNALVEFLRDSGVDVSPEGGLVGILSELRDIRAKLDRAKEAERAAAAATARAALAEQVAHDIRSPLAALDSAAAGIARLPEEQRSVVHGAAARIRDIANQLLGDHLREDARPAAAGSAPVDRLLLSSLIDPIITEKRVQFSSQPGIEIVAKQDEASYGHFAKVEATEFKRALSNLIDNGVDALPGRGSVKISVARSGDFLELRVIDDGKGIAPEVLKKLGRRGESYGKPGGSGLGLHHAKTCVEAGGGALEIESEAGKGTTVLIRLPAAQPPAWFASQMDLSPESAVIVLDDDPSVHQVWQSRLESPAVREARIEALYFSRAEELRQWVKANSERAARARYLLDYELRGSTDTGLSLAKELGIEKQTFLVTGHYDEQAIKEKCLRLNIRMIPKALAGSVPITGLPSSRIDAVLVDDDPLVHAVWKAAARVNGKRVETFSAPQEFMAKVERLDKATPIYVDSKIKDGVRGEDFAKELNALGFRNLYLATGRQRESFPAMPWIKEVVGKNAPWG